MLVFVLMGSALYAEQLDLWIGFTGVQTKQTKTGKVRYIDAMVGSNEKPEEAQGYVFATYLSGAGSGGGCTTFTEVATKVKPAVALLRFQVFYPAPQGLVKGPRQPKIEIVPLVDYKLKAYMTGAPDNQGSSSNNTHEFTFSFPGGGGPPTCAKLK